MENFLKKPLVVPFETLYLDPNNPRLALEDPPSYENPKKLFDADLQTMLEKRIEDVYDVKAMQGDALCQPETRAGFRKLLFLAF